QARIGDRQLLGVAANPLSGVLALRPGAANTLAQHVGIDIADRDRGLAAALARQIGDAERNVPRTAGNIEIGPARTRIEPFDEDVLPDPVDAAGHQIVHQIVAPGDRRKDLAHKAFLLGLRHVAIAETGGVSSHRADNSLGGVRGLPSGPATLNGSLCPSYPKSRP